MEQGKHEELRIARRSTAKMAAIEWVMANYKRLLTTMCTLFVLLFCVMPFTKRMKGNAKSDYLAAEAAFIAWIAQTKHDLDLYKQLKAPLNRHPELDAKFGTLMAQRFLGLGETKMADQYASSALKRTKTLLSPYYLQFSHNTLSISQGHLAEALKQSYELKKRMGEDEAFWSHQDAKASVGVALYAYNLLRIASLEREVGSKEGELAAWEELMRHAGWGGYPPQQKMYDPETYQMLAQNFQTGEVSLIDYIQQRKRILASSP